MSCLEPIFQLDRPLGPVSGAHLFDLGVYLLEPRCGISNLPHDNGDFRRIHFDQGRLGNVRISLRPTIIEAAGIQGAKREATETATADTERSVIRAAGSYRPFDAVSGFRHIPDDRVEREARRDIAAGSVASRGLRPA